MTKLHKKEPFLLALGDAAFFVISLWLTLVLRYFALPTPALFQSHIEPFSVLFIIWILVFFIAGLYEKQTLIVERRLPGMLFKAFLGNAFLSFGFFYLIPSPDIAPKTNLFLDLAISYLLILLWRLAIGSLSSAGSRQNALIVASGKDLRELRAEIDGNSRYSFRFAAEVDLDKVPATYIEAGIADAVRSGNAAVIVADFTDARLAAVLPRFYDFLFSGTTFLDFGELYEDVFERVPLSLVSHEWFLQNISLSRKTFYDAFKRCMDIVLSLPVGVIALIAFPFIWIALKIQDGGPVSITQERIGEGGRTMNIYKYRSMRGSDRGAWVGKNDNRVTPVGALLRKSRLDEFLQFWNVLRGDISFIGPRPDIIGTYEHLVKELPYYRVRSVVKPGLSGWAQIKQEKPPQSLEETRLRLAYDFYYIKNRSLFLDLKIALRTIQTLLSRLGV